MNDGGKFSNKLIDAACDFMSAGRERIRSSRESDAAEKKAKRWDRYFTRSANIVSIITLAFTAITIAINTAQMKLNRQALLANTRGWIAPAGIKIELATLPDGTSGIGLHIRFNNVGKTLATRTKIATSFDWLDISTAPGQSSRSAYDVATKSHLEIANTCRSSSSRLKIKLGEQAIWPNAEAPSSYDWLVRTSGVMDHIPFLQAAKETFLVQGCIWYETNKEMHHTWFCMMPRSDPAKAVSDFDFVECPAGNGGD